MLCHDYKTRLKQQKMLGSWMIDADAPRLVFHLGNGKSACTLGMDDGISGIVSIVVWLGRTFLVRCLMPVEIGRCQVYTP